MKKTNIEIDEQKKIFLLKTEKSSYGFKVNKDGFLMNLYWGGALKSTADLPEEDKILAYAHRHPDRGSCIRQEYPGWGGSFYGEPALKLNFANGVRSLVLKYQSHKLEKHDDNEVLSVRLAFDDYPVGITLHYRVWKNCEVIDRWTSICNTGKETIEIESVMSASFCLPRIDGDYRVTHLSGRWANEGTINRVPLKQSKLVVESRSGLSGPYAMPFITLDKGDASEQAGRVWFGTLQWSGNWKITACRQPYEEVAFTGGVNDFDFMYPLKAGETFTSPVFSAGVSSEGFGGVSRIIHSFQRKHILPKAAAEPIPLLVNTWASLHADVDEASVMAVIEKASEIGAELFVIDDGWQTALGDWYPNKKTFPRGLKPLIDRAKELGMNFGLWVEIESFEKKSALFKEHPEWAMRFAAKEPPFKYRDDVDRTSYLINFARQDVLEFFYKTLSKLLRETGISYLKLDMNYFFTDPGWDELPEEDRRKIWYCYAENVLKLFECLSKEFPDVRFENCASGCARSDLAMSHYFGRINRSDNQDSLDILKLHEGFTQLHMPGLAGGACHISDDMYHVNKRRMPLQFQALTGMLGSLAVGKNLPKCSRDEISAIAHWGDIYKKIRHITYKGDFYRLVSHYDRNYAAYGYVSQDKTEALLFVFCHFTQFSIKAPAIQMQGLDPDAIYSVELYGDSETHGNMSGTALMEVGIQTFFQGDYTAKLFHFKKV